MVFSFYFSTVNDTRERLPYAKDRYLRQGTEKRR